MGCLCSGITFAPVINTISAGPMVTERNAAQAIVKVLVNASGLNSLPSWASSVNTGMKLTVMTSSAKNSGLPIKTIHQLKDEIESICGGAPNKPEFLDNVIAAIKWVDGTVIDVVKQLA